MGLLATSLLVPGSVGKSVSKGIRSSNRVQYPTPFSNPHTYTHVRACILEHVCTHHTHAQGVQKAKLLMHYDLSLFAR